MKDDKGHGGRGEAPGSGPSGGGRTPRQLARRVQMEAGGDDDASDGGPKPLLAKVNRALDKRDGDGGEAPSDGSAEEGDERGQHA